MLLRLPTLWLPNLVLIVGLLLLLIPWPYQVGPVWISSVDLSAIFFWGYILFIGVATFRFTVTLRMMLFLGSFALLQVLGTMAWFSHPGDRGLLQLIWHIFKNIWVFTPFPIIGVMLARASTQLRWYFIRVVLVITCFISVLGILQTLTSAYYFSGLFTNYRYLGFLTPLPQDLYDTIIFDTQMMRATGSDNYFVGPFFRAHGPFLQSNPYSTMLAALSAFSLAFVLMDKRRPVSHLARATFILAMIAMLMTFGLTGYVALLVTTSYAMLIRFKDTLYILLNVWFISFMLGVLLAGGFWLANNPRSLMEQIPEPVVQRLMRLSSIEKSRGFNNRFMLWTVVTERIADRPLLGTGREVTAREAGWADMDSPLRPHNSYLTVAMYNGIPAAMVFFIIVFYGIRRTWQIYTQGLDQATRTLGLACHLSFVGLAIMGLTDDWVIQQSAGGFFWICTGLSVRIATRQVKVCKLHVGLPIAIKSA